MSDPDAKPDFPRTPAIVGMILSAVPMLVYPFVMMANLMSFVAEPNPEATSFERIASTTFLVLSTAYPVSWIGGLVSTVVLLTKQRPKAAMWTGAWPLFHVALVVGAWWMWSLA